MKNKISDNLNNIENSIQNVYNENNIDSSEFSTNNPDKNIHQKNVTNNELNNINENNTSNCLALTIRQDYKLTSKTNVFLRSLRMSFKVFVSYVTLNIIKLFF